MKFTFPKTAIHPDDQKTMFAEWEAVAQYYGIKHSLAMRVRPARILEIGVRRGYSAFAFLSGAWTSEYLGIDALNGTYGGTTDCYKWAERLLANFPNVTLLHADTQKMDRLFTTEKFDLVHVDGDHSEAGALHDMELVWPQVRRGGLMVVDDYDYQPAVRKAVHSFRSNRYNGYLSGLVPYLEYGEDYRGEAIFQKPRTEGEMIGKLIGPMARDMEGAFIEIGCGERSTLQFGSVAPSSSISIDLDAKKAERVQAELDRTGTPCKILVGHSWRVLGEILGTINHVSFAFLDSGLPSPYAHPTGAAVLTFGEFKMMEHLFQPGSCVLIDNAMLPDLCTDFYGYRAFPKGRILVPYLIESGRWDVAGFPHDAGGMVVAHCKKVFEGDFPPGAVTWSIEKIDEYIRGLLREHPDYPDYYLTA